VQTALLPLTVHMELEPQGLGLQGLPEGTQFFPSPVSLV
jgi:hypothetical protein